MIDSSMPGSVLIVGGIAILIVVVLFVFIARKGNTVDLTSSREEKPEWMIQAPPDATIAATKAEGLGVQAFGQEPGEALASPFAEQIEDIVHAKLAADPALAEYKVDLGTAADGGLEISVNGEKYAAIDAIPDEKLKQLLHDAVEQWDKS